MTWLLAISIGIATTYEFTIFTNQIKHMSKGGVVYILSSPNRNVLYTGVTSDISNRVWKHKNKFYENSFTQRYDCVVLVWYKYFDSMSAAIAEEKRIKGGSRKQKEDLINSFNYEWKDLWDIVKDIRTF